MGVGQIFPSLASEAKQAGFLRREIPGEILAGFYRPAADLRNAREPKPARRPSHDSWRFFVETVSTRYRFGYSCFCFVRP